MRLYLLRHAKSDWDAPADGDHDRPLAPRGEAAADRVGRAVAALGAVPDLALCSTARRARDTLARAIAAGGWESDVRHTDALYMASPHDVIEVLRETPGDARTVMVVGHEPTGSELVEALCGARVELPTASLVRLDLDAERWADLRPEGATLRWLLTPKLLGRLGLA